MLVAPPPSPAESIIVALPSALGGAGQHQRRTSAEGFVAAQSYETLLGVDCRGRPYAKLARAWSAQRVENGWRWTITLDTAARFWNGDLVAANDVLTAWRSTSDPPSGELARLVAAAAVVVDNSSFHVTLSDSTPLFLAHASLAIHGALSPRRAGAAARVRVWSADAAAARDALDGGADLLVTDDPAIVAYAAHNDDIVTHPLPWERTYVVLAAHSAAMDVSATYRLTLAGLLAGAVRADFRTAEEPFWFGASNNCTAHAGIRPVAPAQQSSRVVFLSGDRVAQGLAERLVALAGSRPARGEDSVLAALLPGLSRAGGQVTAAALASGAFAAAFHAGGDLAYVLPLARFSVAPCHEFAMLRRAAPWLQSVVPLIDTRPVALVRRGRIGLAVDADGTLRLLHGASGENGKP